MLSLIPISILFIFAIEQSFKTQTPNHISIKQMISHLFSSVFLLPQFFLWMWIVFFLISPSELSWIIALLLVEKSIMLDCATVFQSLYTMFSWFCSFHSASIPGGHSNSYGISLVHYSFEFIIPSPTDTTVCLAISQLKDIHSFSSFFA